VLGKLPQPESSFPYVLGMVDGMLTALTLATGRVIGGNEHLDGLLAIRISAASALSGAFVFFAAEYTRLRGRLARAERQLSLQKAGYLASTRLGRWALMQATSGAVASSGCNFLGALLPLLGGALLPGPAWLPVALTLAALGILGFVLAHTVQGNSARWVLGLLFIGGVLALVGLKLHVV